MIVLLNLDGSVTKITPEHIYQGSINVDRVDVLTKFPATTSISMSVTVNDEVQTPIIMTRTQTTFDNVYNVWSATLNGVMTQFKGQIKMSFTMVDVLGNTLTSATLNIPVEESQVEPLPPTPTEDVYNQILAELAKKQNLEDEGLETISKFVVEAINELNTKAIDFEDRITQNTEDIQDNAQEIESNTQRISALEQQAITGLDFIGQYPASETFPTQEELTQFVRDNTEDSREPRNGDYVRFYKINGSSQTPYNVFYSTVQGWTFDEIIEAGRADNSVYGIIKGTSTEDLTTKIDIVDGKILNILTKNNSGTPTNIATRLNTLDTRQSNIINGTIKVGSADKASKDGLGRVINETYATPQDVTNIVEDYALPKEFGNLLYISKDGFLDSPPTSPADGKQFSVTNSSAGEFLLAEVTGEVGAKYDVTSKDNAQVKAWISSNRTATLSFRIVLSFKKTTESDYTDVSAILVNDTNFVQDEIQSIETTVIFDLLGNNKLELESGDLRRLRIYATLKESVETTVDLYSNSTRASTFYLNTQSVTVTVNTIGGYNEISLPSSRFTLDETSGLYMATIPQSEHGQPVRRMYDVKGGVVSGGNIDELRFQYSVATSGGTIYVYIQEPRDCLFFVASDKDVVSQGILMLTNPENLNLIDYTKYGVLKIEQTETAQNLTLPTPQEVNVSYKIFVYNDSMSTEQISVNDTTIDIGAGVKFNWVGSWVIGEVPDKTSEIYDDVKGQALNTTLAGYNQNFTNIDLKQTQYDQDIQDLQEKNVTYDDNFDKLSWYLLNRKVVGTVEFNQDGGTPIQTITDITSGNIIPIDLSTAVLDITDAPQKNDGTVQQSWLDTTPYSSGATPTPLTFYSSSMPIRANATGSVLLLNPIVGQNSRLDLTISYSKATNTSLTLGIVVLNTTTQEVVRYTQFTTITSATQGSATLPEVDLKYKAGDKFVLFVQPTYSGGSLTSVSINKLKISTDFVKGE